MAKGSLGVFGHKNPKGYSIYDDPRFPPLGVAGACTLRCSMGGGVNVNDFLHCSIDCAVAACLRHQLRHRETKGPYRAGVPVDIKSTGLKG